MGMIPQLLLIREIQLFLMSMHLVIPSTLRLNFLVEVAIKLPQEHFLVLLELKMENYHGIQREYLKVLTIMSVLPMHLLEWADRLLLSKF